MEEGQQVMESTKGKMKEKTIKIASQKWSTMQQSENRETKTKHEAVMQVAEHETE